MCQVQHAESIVLLMQYHYMVNSRGYIMPTTCLHIVVVAGERSAMLNELHIFFLSLPRR
jgi:hypothetical protein